MNISPKRFDMSKFPPTTPDYCPFSVEIEPSSSHSFDHLRLSTANKSWSLAMKTTIRGSSLIDQGDVNIREDKDDVDDDLPLNQMDADIGRALSHEKAPVGLVPVSSDSESSSRDDSLDIDTDDEDVAAHLSVPTSGAGSSHLPCNLSPRLSSRGEAKRNPQQAVPLNPLNPLKVLNPGVPHGHASLRSLKRQQSTSRVMGTPKRGDCNALTTSESNVVTSSAADCMCFAIEDLTQFFCPGTPRSTTLDTTTQYPSGMDCFPAYDYELTSSPSALGGSLKGFWISPKNSPLPRSRENLYLLNENLPRNRSHSQKRKHVRKLLAVWHGTEGLLETDNFGSSRDDFFLVDKRQRRRKRSSVTQSKCCYDSDPEQEVLGRSRRRSSLHAARQPRFRKFCPEPFTHLDTDEESSSDDDTSSYETAKCTQTTTSSPLPPAAPRNSDPKISFDFGKNLSSVEVDGATDDSDEFKADRSSHAIGKDPSMTSVSTSLSTTGHSRFHTIRRSPEQVQEGTDSIASSDGFSSVSGSTALNAGANPSQQGQHLLPSYFQSFPTHWTEFQLLFSRNVDEDSVKSHVHELSNVRFPLVWHPRASPPQTGDSMKAEESKDKAKATSRNNIHSSTSAKIASLSSNASEEPSSDASPSKGTPYPISVQGAFEVGAHLEHMVVQPKFTWTPLAQPVRLSEDPEANHRELFLSGSSPPQVELLSIIRVNKAMAKNLDRNLYPYARPERTCIVSTNDQKHPTIVLEARSTQERDWLVFSLKLIVARLASIIITRDEDMLHEFFSPYSALMRLEEEETSPAEAPQPASHQEELFECASTPTASCGKGTLVVEDEGSNHFTFPKDSDDATVDHNSHLMDEAMENVESDDEEDDAMVDCAYQVRDDREIEDSIHARNSGAYAILKRSLTATGPLMDEDLQDDHVVRTFSL